MEHSGASLPPAGPPLVFVARLDVPELADEDRRHLARSLRVRPGETITVADGAGRWCAARFGDDIEPTAAVVEVEQAHPTLSIGFASTKGHRPELVVQKLTELGVDRIVPFVADRSIARPDQDRATRQLERLRRIAREAAMQCRRPRLPEVAEPTSFDRLVAAESVVLADRAGAPPTLESATVLIGPEGGWSDRERGAVEARVGLGPQIMRAETAAIAAGALLAALRAGLLRPGQAG